MAKLEGKDRNITALWTAASHQQWDIVRVLLQNGAKNIDVCPLEGEGINKTALLYATYYNEPLLQALLIIHGAMVHNIRNEDFKNGPPIQASLMQAIKELEERLNKSVIGVISFYHSNAKNILPKEILMQIMKYKLMLDVPELQSASDQELYAVLDRTVLEYDNILATLKARTTKTATGTTLKINCTCENNYEFITTKKLLSIFEGEKLIITINTDSKRPLVYELLDFISQITTLKNLDISVKIERVSFCEMGLEFAGGDVYAFSLFPAFKHIEALTIRNTEFGVNCAEAYSNNTRFWPCNLSFIVRSVKLKSLELINCEMTNTEIVGLLYNTTGLCKLDCSTSKIKLSTITEENFLYVLHIIAKTNKSLYEFDAVFSDPQGNIIDLKKNILWEIMQTLLEQNRLKKQSELLAVKIKELLFANSVAASKAQENSAEETSAKAPSEKRCKFF